MKLVEISELFYVTYGHKLDLNKMRVVSDGIAFVNRTGFNNGVVAYVEQLSDQEPSPAGSLTIALGGSVLSTFLQVKPFYTGQNVAIAIPKIKMSNANLLYYATAIQRNKFRYSTCGREANRTFRTLLIPDLSEIPSWIQKADVDMYDGIDAPAISNLTVESQTNNWQPFEFQSLFEIERGCGPRRKDLDGSGSTPFVSSSDSNNGVTGITSTPACHKGNTIGV